MGRETKILLGLLATLTAVFVAALFAKLLVPRPPAGTGVDIHSDLAVQERQEVVEPPGFGRPAVSAFAAAAPEAEPIVESKQPSGEAAIVASPREPVSSDPVQQASAFVRATAQSGAAPEPPPVTPASYEEPLPPEPHPPRATSASPPASRAVAGTDHVVVEGDSWWGIAEAAYGDGGCYRALYAWNKVLNPRVGLAPGTRVEIPSFERLSAAHGGLLPTSGGRINLR